MSQRWPRHRTVIPRRGRAAHLAILLAVAFAHGCGLAATRGPGAEPARDDSLSARAGVAAESSNLAALRTAVLAYAGRYREAVAFAIDQSFQSAETPGQRYTLQVIKVAYVTGTLTNATGPDAVIDLRNLVVEAQLERIVWNDPGILDEFPAPVVELMRDALARVEADILDVASKVVRPQTLAALRRLVIDWRSANPDQDYVAFVQLDTTQAAKIDARWTEDARRGGFFAPVSEAARQIALTREAAERALFIANLTPMLLEWNAELVLLRTLATPEAARVGEYSQRLVLAAESLQATIQELPGQIEAEREALLRQFGDLVRSERRATLTMLAEEAVELQPLLDSLGRASLALRDTAASLERLFPPAPAGQSAGDGSDVIESLDTILQNSVILTGQLQVLLDEIQPLIVGETSAEGLALLDAAVIRHSQRLFWYAAALLVLAAGLALLVIWFARRQVA